MIRKIDWLLQSETGWQKFTQKTKRQPEKILSDFKRLQGTNAAALGKKPAGCFLPKCPKWFRHQELVSSQNSDILGICFCSKHVYIIPQDFRDFFVICPEKYWKMVPSVPFSIAPQEVFFRRPRRSGPRASPGTACQGDPTKNNSTPGKAGGIKQETSHFLVGSFRMFPKIVGFPPQSSHFDTIHFGGVSPLFLETFQSPGLIATPPKAEDEVGVGIFS